MESRVPLKKEINADSEGVHPVEYVEEDQPINLHANEVYNEMHKPEFEIANLHRSFEMEIHKLDIAEFYEG
ncbi:MAG: hypothetical protein ACK521_00130 [bacterium]